MVAAAALAAAACLLASAAHAELRYRVVLLRPPVTDDVTADALARVQGELRPRASRSARCPATPPWTCASRWRRRGASWSRSPRLRSSASRTRRRSGSAIASPASPSSRACAWTRPWRRASRRSSAVLAVRAVELLRASLAQYWLAASTAPGAGRLPSMPAAAAAVPEVAKFATAGVGLQAGIGWLESAGAVGPVWQPIVRASYGGGHGWAVRLTVGGLGTEAEPERGQRRQRQHLAAAGRAGDRARLSRRPPCSAARDARRGRVSRARRRHRRRALTSAATVTMVAAHRRRRRRDRHAGAARRAGRRGPGAGDLAAHRRSPGRRRGRHAPAGRRCCCRPACSRRCELRVAP